jgi:hypothetical protein
MTKDKNSSRFFLDNHQDIVTNYMYLGLLPFFIGAFGPWIFIAEEPFLIRFFLFYSSIIFVFLAGSLWTIALVEKLIASDAGSSKSSGSPRTVHCAIVFSLWPLGCYLLPPLYAVTLMLTGYLLLLSWEKLFVNQHYSPWYKALRHKITFIVVACHMLSILNIVRTDVLI